jgi:parallel beta-helix repeat protein
VLSNSANNNTIWNNSITSNGADGTGDGTFAGIWVDNAYSNSISTNDITGNDDWAVYFSTNQDNVLAMNNITGNNDGGGAGGGVYHSGSYWWVNAQHNWWGSASGPTGMQTDGGTIVTMYHRSSAVTRPGSGVQGPVFNSTQGKVYYNLGTAVDAANSSEAIVVRAAGLFEEGVYPDVDGLTVSGTGMNDSYLYIPYSYVEITAAGIVFSGFDVDAGNYYDPTTGGQVTINYDGNYQYSLVNLYDYGDMEVSNNRIRGGWDGIYISSGAYDATISSNQVLWNHNTGISVGGYENTNF